MVPAGEVRTGGARVLSARSAQGSAGAALPVPAGRADCLAAHLKGSLEELEAAVRARPPGSENPDSPASVRRWLGRRKDEVRARLVTVKGLIPERFTGVEPTLADSGSSWTATRCCGSCGR